MADKIYSLPINPEYVEQVRNNSDFLTPEFQEQD
jgi:carbamoylphosphate synthase large subunit